jgi:TrmH family RNA methyltransferase
MLTKAKVKLIQGLEQKRHRQREGLFLAEGPKVVAELLDSRLQIAEIICTEAWSSAHAPRAMAYPIEVVTYSEMRKITQLTHATDVLALAYIPEEQQPDLSRGLWIALDAVQDPGNVGTIIRTAEWFGFAGVLCGAGTADVWAPKVVQSTMGALFRLPVIDCNLAETLQAAVIPVFSTTLDGDDLYAVERPAAGIVVIGNEAQGVSEAVRALAMRSLTIPPSGRRTEAGLNAAVAAALVMAAWRRKG